MVRKSKRSIQTLSMVLSVFKKSFYYFILIDKSTSKDNSTLAKKLTFVLNINDKKMKLNGEQLCTWFGTWMFDY